MPKLRHIRVINAHFNKGKGIYQDFNMPFHGYNATYELLNGGGKSVLLMLLMQCILPNTALDPNKPFKYIFEGGDSHRTTHILAEWELDESTSEDKFLLTGFCAKKRPNQEEDDNQRNEVQYFNYIHLYSKKNDLDIHQIPLCWWEGEEFVVQDYSKTRSMLQNSVSEYTIRIAEKKKEYQEWLKTFYLLDSEWELIKSINKRENHIKDHFGKYKKSRSLVEGLLIETIEECLEDRQRLNQMSDVDNPSKDLLAEALFQSQDDLRRLQEEQYVLRDYEQLLSEVGNLTDANDRLIRAFQRYDETKMRVASQYHGYEAAIQRKNNQIEKLQEKICNSKIDQQNLLIEIEKIQLMKLNAEVNLALKDKEETEREKSLLEGTVRDLECKKDYAFAVNKFLKISGLEDEKNEKEEILRNIREEHGDLFNQINPLGKTLYLSYKNEINLLKEQIETDTRNLEDLQSNIDSLNSSSGSLTTQIKQKKAQIVDFQGQLLDLDTRSKELDIKLKSFPTISSGLFLPDKIEATDHHIDELKQKLGLVTVNIETLMEEISESRSNKATLIQKIENYRVMLDIINREYETFLEKKNQAQAIVKAHDEENIQSCHQFLQNRMEELSEKVATQKSILSKLRQNLETVKKFGFSLTEDFVNALTIFTENYPSAMSGAEYLKGQSEDQRNQALSHAPWLPKTILLLDKHFHEIVHNPTVLPAEIQDSQIIIASLDSLREGRALELGDVFIPHRSVDHSIEVLSKDRTIEQLERKITKQEAKIDETKGIKKNLDEDFSIIRRYLDRYSEDYESVKITEIAEHSRHRGECEERLDEIIQLITTDEQALTEKKENRDHIQSQIDLFVHKSELLKELLNVEEEQLGIRNQIAGEKNQATEIQSSLNRTNIRIEQEKFEAALKGEALRQLDTQLIVLNNEVTEFEGYKETEAEILDTVEIRSIRSKYFALKEVIDTKNLDLGTIDKRIVEIQNSISELWNDIKRLGISEEEIASNNPNQPYSEQYFDNISSKIDDFQRRLSDANACYLEVDENYRTREIEFRQKIKSYNTSFAPETYHPMPDLTDTSQLERELWETIQKKESVAFELTKLETSLNGEKQETETLSEKFGQYKILAGIHSFDTTSAIITDELEDPNILKNALERGQHGVKKSKEQFEITKDRFLESLNDITIASAFKNSIRYKLRAAEDHQQATFNEKNLEEYSSQIVEKIEMGKKIIESLKMVETKIVDQALQMAMLYRDYLKKFPEISKIYLNGRSKNMVKINFDQCIYSDEQAKTEMRRYIQDLNRGIETGSIGQEEVKKALQPGQLVNKVMEMGKIRVKIRKIDRDTSEFQGWETINASDGQENTMYIIFITILMSFIRDIVVGRADTNTSKVMIIDNPFGSTGAYYLWEPIWSILEKSNVQLICTGHKIGAKVREFFPINHILTENKSASGQIRIGIKVEASGPAREAIDEMDRETLSQWINPV